MGVGMSEKKKGRERVIRDIETVDEAIKAEKDVEVGYHNAIEENVLLWLATEEDIIDSYSKLMKNSESPKIKATLTKIIEDSKNHIRILTSIRKSFDKIASDEHRHAKMLEELSADFKK
jgi:rubrerythrin